MDADEEVNLAVKYPPCQQVEYWISPTPAARDASHAVYGR